MHIKHKKVLHGFVQVPLLFFFFYFRGEGAGEGRMVMKGAEDLVILKGGGRLTDSLPLYLFIYFNLF